MKNRIGVAVVLAGVIGLGALALTFNGLLTGSRADSRAIGDSAIDLSLSGTAANARAHVAAPNPPQAAAAAAAAGDGAPCQHKDCLYLAPPEVCPPECPAGYRVVPRDSKPGFCPPQCKYDLTPVAAGECQGSDCYVAVDRAECATRDCRYVLIPNDDKDQCPPNCFTVQSFQQ